MPCLLHHLHQHGLAGIDQLFQRDAAKTLAYRRSAAREQEKRRIARELGSAARIGETIELEQAFPADYRVEALRGKVARFTITLKGLKTRQKPALDDDLAKDVGIEGIDTLDGLRARIRSDIRFATRRERDFRLPADFDVEAHRIARPWQIGPTAGVARIGVQGDTASVTGTIRWLGGQMRSGRNRTWISGGVVSSIVTLTASRPVCPVLSVTWIV